VIVSFTPRTSPEVKALIDRGRDPNDLRVELLEMTLLDNIANLPQTFIDEVVGTFRGTRLEAQEIYGEYLDAVEGALWSPELLDRCRVDDYPALDVVEVGVDPPGETAAECGIVVAGLEATKAERKRAFVIADYSMKGRPEDWARKAVEALKLHGARGIVAEANQV
jgi:phage terminase large subunit-like protein